MRDADTETEDTVTEPRCGDGAELRRPALGQFVFVDSLLFPHWTRATALTPKEHSLIVVASLVASGSTPDQLEQALDDARHHGTSDHSLLEAIWRLAPHTGWTRVLAAVCVAQPHLRRTTAADGSERPAALQPHT